MISAAICESSQGCINDNMPSLFKVGSIHALTCVQKRVGDEDGNNGAFVISNGEEEIEFPNTHPFPFCICVIQL